MLKRILVKKVDLLKVLNNRLESSSSDSSKSSLSDVARSYFDE